MGYPNKIATCCYCGTRAALILKGGVQHELACRSCGAPLHDLKMLPKNRMGDRELVDAPKPRKDHSAFASKPVRKSKSKKKKRKGFVKDLFEEAFDFLEDIFD